ncbi:MAG TPA: hypothetical protein VH835_03835 [Dongiaceae bacterium]|jgi:hypothetical protein
MRPEAGARCEQRHIPPRFDERDQRKEVDHMTGTLLSRNDIPEPPSIAAISPLGWAAVTPALIARNGTILVDDQRDAAEDFRALDETPHVARMRRLRDAVRAILSFRFRSASAGGMTSAA